jgi:hypothetical protein
MKKYVSAAVFLCLAAALTFGQTAASRRKSSSSPAPKKVSRPASAAAAVSAESSSITEVPEAEWQAMAAAARDENWEAAATLAARNLARLKIENQKKQLAQLRYVYLHSLAGRAAEGKLPFAELERLAGAFVGQEFLLAPRQILSDCRTKVNYICAAQNGGDRVLRVTTTNRAGNAIHSFEYVVLDEKFDARAHNEKVAFLGGTLKKVESRAVKADAKVIRLVFEKGFVKLATD